MKKTVSFLLVLCLMFSLSVSAFAAELTPSTDKSSVAAGTDVTVTLTLSEDISQVKNIGYMLRYNGDLFEFKSGAAGETTGVVISRAMTDKTGSFVRASFVDTTSQGVTMKKGVFARLTFTAKTNVSESTNASFSLEYEGGDDVNGEITHTAGAAASVDVAPAVYTVTFNTANATYGTPECLEGPATATHGTDYTFRLKEPYYSDHANYVFSNPGSIVKMGNKQIGTTDGSVIDHGDGTYTVKNVTGNLEFTQRVVGRQLNCTVTVNQQKPETVDAGLAPRYKTDYDYPYTGADSDMLYTVTAKVGGREVEATLDTKWLDILGSITVKIAAKDVTGDVELFIEELPKTTAITLDGAAASDGKTSLTAETRKDFTFSLQTESGWKYTVKLGDTVLTPNANGQYTIPGSMIQGKPLTVKVTALAPTKIVVEGGALAAGTTDTAYAGTDYRFSLKTESGWKYTVKLGDTVLTPDANGRYTIPGSMIAGEKLVLSVTRVKDETPSTVTPVGPAPAQPGETEKADGVHTAFVSGYSDGSFRPLNRITRSETAAMLCRLLSDSEKQTALAAGKSFSDVPADAWYRESVAALAGMGVINGRPDGSFAPTQNITRAEFAAMLTRFRTEGSESASVTFTDISGHWAESAIRTAAARGWVKGMTDGTFRPDEGITRAEAVTMICRMLGREPASAEALLSGMTEFTDNQNTAAWYYCYVQEAACGHSYRTTDAGEIWTELRK